MAANYKGIQNTSSTSQKIKQFLEREALNVEFLFVYRFLLCYYF